MLHQNLPPVAGVRHAPATPAIATGLPIASNQLLPNEIWSHIHGLLDLPGKCALAQVDVNLHGFSLPTAQAHLRTAVSLVARHRYGLRLVRRAVVVLQKPFEDPAVRDRHVRQLLSLAATIGHGWSDRKALDIVHAALCDVVPRLAPELARSVLAHLAMLHQRACTSYAEQQLSPTPNRPCAGESMSLWRDLLHRQHARMRAADHAAHGVLRPGVWQRLDDRLAGSLGDA